MAKIIIEEGYGYPVELFPGATIPLFQGMRAGDVDVVNEVWLQNQQEAMDEATAAGDIVLLGNLNNDNWQSGFVVPTYVIEGDPDRGIEPMAPNLMTVFDLDQPEYKELIQNLSILSDMNNLKENGYYRRQLLVMLERLVLAQERTAVALENSSEEEKSE